MENSILNLIFPVSSEKCFDSRGSEKTKLNIQFRTKKIFSKVRKNATRLGLLVTSNPDVKVHHRRLLFQAAVTAAQSCKRVLIITPQPWDELPLDSENGVHKMPKVTLEHFQSFNFVYPRNLNELFLYISALGGVNIVKEMPDLILLENVEDLSDLSMSDEMEDLGEEKEKEKVSQRMSKLFSFLENLSTLVGDHKRFDVLVSSTKKYNSDLIEKNYFWLDEIWETATTTVANGEEDMELFLLSNDQTVDLKLKFSFSSSSNQYLFKSLMIETENCHTEGHDNGDTKDSETCDLKELDNHDAEETEMCDDYDPPSSPVL